MRWKQTKNEGRACAATPFFIEQDERCFPRLVASEKSHATHSKWKKKLQIGCISIITALSTPVLATTLEQTAMQPIAHRQSIDTGYATLYSGSLQRNLTRLAGQYGWKKLVWLPESDYQWVGQVSVRENDVYTVFERVLNGYPLQAVFYKGNHVLVIRPRNV